MAACCDTYQRSRLGQCTGIPRGNGLADCCSCGLLQEEPAISQEGGGKGTQQQRQASDHLEAGKWLKKLDKHTNKYAAQLEEQRLAGCHYAIAVIVTESPRIWPNQILMTITSDGG